MPPGFAVGDVWVGSWSRENGDVIRQSVISVIQYGEAFCMLAAAVEFGPMLHDSHIVFVIDNDADVWIFNRLRTRDTAVCRLLRCVADQAREFNFSFKVIHRYGEDNDLMDWASRPARHCFSHRFVPAPPPALPRTSLALLSLLAFPPLLKFNSLMYVNSRCLTFVDEGTSAHWSSRSSGW
jgi:hypothetical protein